MLKRSEIALNTRKITDSDLDVRFLMKICIRIQRITLSKSSPHSLVWSKWCFLTRCRRFIADLMKSLNNSAIQISLQQVIASLVARHVAVGKARGENSIRLPHLSDSR